MICFRDLSTETDSPFSKIAAVKTKDTWMRRRRIAGFDPALAASNHSPEFSSLVRTMKSFQS